MLTYEQHAQFEADWNDLSNGASVKEAAAQRQHQHFEDELRRLSELSPAELRTSAKGCREKTWTAHQCSRQVNCRATQIYEQGRPSGPSARSA